MGPRRRARPATRRGLVLTAWGFGPPALLATSASGSTWLVALAGFAIGLGAWLVMTVAEWGAWALVLPGRRLAASGADPGPDPGEPIEATAPDGTRLAGAWYPARPESGSGIGPAPAAGRTVLLVHGFAEVGGAWGSRVEFLARRGWNVARLDMRAYGRSGGDRASFGGREGDDLRAWLGVVAGRVGPDAPLAVWGRSMGAAIALRGAADERRVAALVLESPYAALAPVLAGWLRRLRLPMPGLLARRILARARRLAGVPLDHLRPIDLAPRVAAATLILHGADDSLVPASDARRLADAFPRPAVRVEVAGAGHGNVVDVGGPELLERIAAFLDGATGR